MNNKMRNWLLGATLAGATAVSAGSWAMGHRGGMEHDPGKMLSRMSKAIELSSEQQVEVEILLTDSNQANAPDRTRLQELRTEIRSQRDDFDAGAAQGIADEIGQLTGRMVYRASETWAQVYQLLDAQQRTELNAMIEKREARRSKWHNNGNKNGD